MGLKPLPGKSCALPLIHFPSAHTQRSHGHQALGQDRLKQPDWAAFLRAGWNVATERCPECGGRLLFPPQSDAMDRRVFLRGFRFCLGWASQDEGPRWSVGRRHCGSITLRSRRHCGSITQQHYRPMVLRDRRPRWATGVLYPRNTRSLGAGTIAPGLSQVHQPG